MNKLDQVIIFTSVVDYALRENPPDFVLEKLWIDLERAINSYICFCEKNIVITKCPQVFDCLFLYFDTNPDTVDLGDLKRQLKNLIENLRVRHQFWKKTKEAALGYFSVN